MSQTKRTLTEIYNLLADNTRGNISATDLRDAIATVEPDRGDIYISSSSATAISDTTSYFEVSGTYTLSGDSLDWDMATNARLRYTGAPDRAVAVTCSCSFTTASNNQVIEIGIAKNGTVEAASVIQRKTSTGADVGSSSTQAFVHVSTNDYLTLVVRNTTSATNATFVKANLLAIGTAV